MDPIQKKTDFACPNCFKGSLLIIPNDENNLICQDCHNLFSKNSIKEIAERQPREEDNGGFGRRKEDRRNWGRRKEDVRNLGRRNEDRQKGGQVKKAKKLIAREIIVLLVLTATMVGLYLVENIQKKKVVKLSAELSLAKVRPFDGISYTQYQKKLKLLEKQRVGQIRRFVDIKEIREKIFFWLLWFCPLYFIIRLLVWALKTLKK